MTATTVEVLPEKLRVTVRRDDFPPGYERNTTNTCPVANAIYRAYGEILRTVHVGKETIGYTERATGRRYTVPTPPSIRKFVEDYEALQIDKTGRQRSFVLDNRKAQVREANPRKGYKRPGNADIMRPGSGRRSRRQK